jgi:thioredoxin-dependent peroxiredoxin
MIAPGQPAPDFTVSDHNGRTLSLSSLRGRRVLLWFYPEADTPGCTKEGCGFRDYKADFDKKGVEILGISFDAVPKNAAFAQKFGFNFPLLSDVDRTVGLAYGAAAEATAARPRRVSYLIGADGRVEKAYGFEAKMDAAAHPAEVLKDLGA